ncbi:MAG: hypothetical protein EOM19_03705 [Candidatus Moranbacteria bacterium]|nr:hypothetical protein [Candidatus Moranbacteria bacterium]
MKKNILLIVSILFLSFSAFLTFFFFEKTKIQNSLNTSSSKPSFQNIENPTSQTTSLSNQNNEISPLTQVENDQQSCIDDNWKKMCPDGNYTYANAPGCSFGPCENENTYTFNDSLWRKYINNDLGFSIMIPRQTLYSSHDFIPVEVKEYGNNVSIFYENSQDLYPFDTLNTWNIHVRKVKNESDIQSFIENETWRKGCKIVHKEPSLQKGVYDLTLNRDPLDIENQCAGMSKYVFKYFPEKGIIAYWETGQDSSFSLPLKNPLKNEYGEVEERERVDTAMIASFEFLL